MSCPQATLFISFISGLQTDILNTLPLLDQIAADLFLAQYPNGIFNDQAVKNYISELFCSAISDDECTAGQGSLCESLIECGERCIDSSDDCPPSLGGYYGMFNQARPHIQPRWENIKGVIKDKLDADSCPIERVTTTSTTTSTTESVNVEETTTPSSEEEETTTPSTAANEVTSATLKDKESTSSGLWWKIGAALILALCGTAFLCKRSVQDESNGNVMETRAVRMKQNPRGLTKTRRRH